MKASNNKYYKVLYKGKVVTNYLFKDPTNANGWVVTENDPNCNMFIWSRREVNNIFLKAGVDIELVEVNL